MGIDLSICIVNHRTPQLTVQCLQSIKASQYRLAIEVLIVNNTLDRIDLPGDFEHAFRRFHLHQNQQPLGFAANQNLMLRRAAGRYSMPLNSDTEVTPDALKELVDFMDEHPDCAIAGPRLIYPDGRLQPSARDFPTPCSHLLEASGLWRLLPRTAWLGRRYALLSPHDQVRKVDWLTGACLIVRQEAMLQVGTFDDGNFSGMYGEDLEWCWRMKQAGWSIYFDPEAVVIHAESASPMGDRTVRMFEGFYTFCRLHYSRSRQVAMRLSTIAALAPRWLLAKDKEQRMLFSRLMHLPVGR